ncbi:lipoprotein ABC transporter ATP-binding protein [Gilvibacter sp. SZ-19]|jgi:lipoprotein-releasing system ATP-binding protein|uniref:ABC transporter ATP-binding protein n=1 Tax=unclassified Gilvibacter TaxID=2625242 RepID=UPI000B3CA6B3|nr:ABC transporter ATP-binding protein [Gilvibacter sp. SZ-19]ARV13220.1 lipoprotein ABC transporter ATP-binding protein [Gilvibacter sp. SZ-19]
MIQAINLHKSYGDLHVLKGVDLKVKKGEIVSVVGASGAGKTTLLQLLGTLDRPDKDTTSLQFQGKELKGLSKKELAEFRNKHLGFIFQFHQLLPEFSALENVCIPGYIAGTPKSEVQKRAQELLDLLGLKERYHHKPSELSGGEQQRAAVARALINNPDLILADEPSGNLDSEAADKLHQLFFELRDQMGQTFIIVTHNNVLADMADRKLTMVDGKIVS